MRDRSKRFYIDIVLYVYILNCIHVCINPCCLLDKIKEIFVKKKILERERERSYRKFSRSTMKKRRSTKSNDDTVDDGLWNWMVQKEDLKPKMVKAGRDRRQV